jgi:hypothetical protein
VEQRVEALIWSAVMSSYNHGLNSAFKPKYNKVIWVNPKVGSENCEVCKALNGVVFDLKDIEGLNNLHPGCSCFTIPKMKL